MKETIETIIEWHKETFPLADLTSQVIRFEEEVIELNSAYSQQMWQLCEEEFADCFIALVGIGRFDLGEFIWQKNLFTRLYDKLHTVDNYELGFSHKAVNEKMAINRQRAKDNYWAYDKQTKQYVARHKLEGEKHDN